MFNISAVNNIFVNKVQFYYSCRKSAFIISKISKYRSNLAFKKQGLAGTQFSKLAFGPSGNPNSISDKCMLIIVDVTRYGVFGRSQLVFTQNLNMTFFAMEENPFFVIKSIYEWHL